MRIAAGLVLLVVAVKAAAGAPTIYRCEQGGATVYSDRPCAADATAHELDGSRVTVYEAPAASERATSSTPPKPAARRAKASTSHEQRQAKCTRLDKSLRDVRTKMRSGYGVKEGERLKERQRELTARRRSEKCS
jgi:hypothetical protein